MIWWRGIRTQWPRITKKNHETYVKTWVRVWRCVVWTLLTWIRRQWITKFWNLRFVAPNSYTQKTTKGSKTTRWKRIIEKNWENNIEYMGWGVKAWNLPTWRKSQWNFELSFTASGFCIQKMIKGAKQHDNQVESLRRMKKTIKISKITKNKCKMTKMTKIIEKTLKTSQKT